MLSFLSSRRYSVLGTRISQPLPAYRYLKSGEAWGANHPPRAPAHAPIPLCLHFKRLHPPNGSSYLPMRCVAQASPPPATYIRFCTSYASTAFVYSLTSIGGTARKGLCRGLLAQLGPPLASVIPRAHDRQPCPSQQALHSPFACGLAERRVVRRPVALPPLALEQQLHAAW